MVNKDPSVVDEDALPAIDEPLARDTHDNMVLGVYATEEDGVWLLQVRDWANRVVETTVYEEGRDGTEEQHGAVHEPLAVPDEMSVEAYLEELLAQRVDAVADEEAAAAADGA